MWIPSRREYVRPSCEHPTIDLSDNRIADLGGLLWLNEKHAGHALALSGNPIDLATNSSALAIIDQLRSKDILVCP